VVIWGGVRCTGECLSMNIINTNDVEAEDITANTIAGKVSRQGIMGQGDDKVTVSVVNFSKGTIREFDNHKFDQILFIAEGKGLIKTKNEEVTVTPGTFVFIPAGEKHSHCATKESGFRQVTIGISP